MVTIFQSTRRLGRATYQALRRLGAGPPPPLYGFFSMPVHVWFLVEEVGLGYNFSWVLPCYSVGIIPPMLLPYLCINDQRYVISAAVSVAK